VNGPGRELELRREYAEECHSCGNCRAVCPIFAEVWTEDAAARGKLSLIRAVLDGGLDLTAIFDEKIQLCLDCKACRDACPNSVPVDRLILAARSGLVEAGRFPFLKRIILRQFLRRGRLLPPVGRTASFLQRVVLRGLPRESALRQLLPVAGIERGRVLPEFAARAFLTGAPEVAEAVGGASPGGVVTPGPADDDREAIARAARTAAFFVGCATNLLYPGTARAIVESLRRSGVAVHVPRDQGCCGTPVIEAGDFVTARAFAVQNVAALGDSRVDVVVTGCASCGLTLKKKYNELLGIDGGIGIPVFDFAEFLAHRDGSTIPADTDADEAPKVRVTYHEPCQLSRGQGIREEPRSVLGSLPWVEFVEMRDSDRCCGGGGTFSLTNYDLASAIGRRKADAIREAGVELVVTECPSCVMQLRDVVAQAGLDVAVVAVADLVAMGYGRAGVGVVAGTGPATEVLGT
jgi:glycolate oxidase iron-sulfur subunit